MVLRVSDRDAGVRTTAIHVNGLDGLAVQMRYGNVIRWVWTGFYTTFAVLYPRPANQIYGENFPTAEPEPEPGQIHESYQDEDAGNNMRVKGMIGGKVLEGLWI